MSKSSFSEFDPYKRPRPGETVDDIVKLERKYLDSRGPNAKPAATAVRAPSKQNCEASDEIQCHIPSEDKTCQLSVSAESCFTGSVFEKYTGSPSPTHFEASEVSERKSRFKMLRTAPLISEPKSSKCVQFQPYNSSRDIVLGMPMPTMPQMKADGKSDLKNLDHSVGEKIHPLLAGYSETDILKAREALLASMEPETKEILLKRRAAALENKTITAACGTKPEGSPIDKDNTDSLHQNLKRFPHMDILETEKLEWTNSVELEEPSGEDRSNNMTETGNPSQVTSSNQQQHRWGRFGLDGKLVTNDLDCDSSTWDRGLHHHGEEMERAGYTIEELFTLSRSTFVQQRTFGYDVLAQIFRRAHNGEFDDCLDISIFEACNELDFVHVIRTGADLWDSLSLNSSINCLSALIFPEQEELCLDIAFNWPNAAPFPWIATYIEKPVTSQIEAENSESDLKDFQYVKNDLLGFLIFRTDILTRFDYILKEGMDLLKEPGVEGILKVLIQVARHSPNTLLEYMDLLRNIQKHYLNPNWLQIDPRPANLSGVPLALALKLFRVLATSSFENASTLYNELSLFPSMMSYLAFKEWGNQKMVKNVEFLVLESSNLWETFLTYGLGIQEYLSFFPVTMSSFQALLSRDILPSFDLAYSARLHALLGKVLATLRHGRADYPALKETIGCVAMSVVKMLTFLGREGIAELLDHDLCLLSILKGLECLTLARTYEEFPDVDQAILKFVGSIGYHNVTKNLRTYSFLLFERDEESKKQTSRYPDNISTCSAILHGGFQTPILNKGSPFPFITSLLRYSNHLFESNDKFKRQLLDNYCTSYIDQLGSADFPSSPNVFLRFELYCIRELIDLLTIPARLLLTSKVLPLVQAGDEELAADFLQIFLNCTNVSTSDELKKFYTTFLFIATSETERHKFKQLNSKAIPRNWISAPLSILFESVQTEIKMKSPLTEALAKVLRDGVETTLDFIVYCLKNCDSILLSSNSSIPALYTRIALVFMMENQLFLDSKIRTLLQDVLFQLLSNRIWNACKNSAVFSPYTQLKGYPSFSSFYSDLVEAFGAISFGDELFAAYLMLPLRPEEDAQVKALFWNEQSIQFLRMRTEQSLIPMEYFTSLPEKDKNILRIYSKAISSKRITMERNPFLYEIISFHVSHPDTTKS